MDTRLTINFEENYNGKLLNDYFGSVRLYDPEKFALKGQFNVTLKRQFIGRAEITAIRVFDFKNIRDVLSFLDFSGPPYLLAAALKKWYPDITFFGEEKLAHIVFKFQERNWNQTNDMILDRIDHINRYYIN